MDTSNAKTYENPGIISLDPRGSGGDTSLTLKYSNLRKRSVRTGDTPKAVSIDVPREVLLDIPNNGDSVFIRSSHSRPIDSHVTIDAELEPDESLSTPEKIVEGNAVTESLLDFESSSSVSRNVDFPADHNKEVVSRHESIRSFVSGVFQFLSPSGYQGSGIRDFIVPKEKRLTSALTEGIITESSVVEPPPDHSSIENVPARSSDAYAPKFPPLSRGVPASSPPRQTIPAVKLDDIEIVLLPRLSIVDELVPLDKKLEDDLVFHEKTFPDFHDWKPMGHRRDFADYAEQRSIAARLRFDEVENEFFTNYTRLLGVRNNP